MLTITIIIAAISTVLSGYYSYKTVKVMGLDKPGNISVLMYVTSVITTGIMIWLGWYWLIIISALWSPPVCYLGYRMWHKLMTKQ